MAVNKTTNFWIMILCMLAGLTVGNFIGSLCDQVAFLKWMNYAGHFGLDSPVQVNLGVLWLSFQVKISITLAGILGMVGGIFIYKKLSS